MGTIARRVAVLVAFGALVVAGCAKDETVSSTNTTTPVTASSGTVAPTGTTPSGEDDDKGSGEYAEACALIEQLDALEGDEVEPGLALIDDIAAASPEELAADWEVLADTFEQLSGLDENDDGTFAKIMEVTSDPAFVAAATDVEDFAQDECGEDLGILPDDDLGGLTDDTRPGDDEIGAPTDPTETDDDPTSIDSLQAHLEANYGTEAWWPVLDDASGWASTGVGDSVEWEITLSDSDADPGVGVSELVAACDAMAEYLDTYEDGDVSITITHGSGATVVTLVTRSPGQPCAAA